MDNPRYRAVALVLVPLFVYHLWLSYSNPTLKTRIKDAWNDRSHEQIQDFMLVVIGSVGSVVIFYAVLAWVIYSVTDIFLMAFEHDDEFDF